MNQLGISLRFRKPFRSGWSLQACVSDRVPVMSSLPSQDTLGSKFQISGPQNAVFDRKHQHLSKPRTLDVVPSSLFYEALLVTVCVLSCFSRVWVSAALWTEAPQAPLSMGFSRQEYWTGLPCPAPGDLPDPGIKLASHVSCVGRWVLYHWCHLWSPWWL